MRPETSNRPQRHPPPTWRGVPVAPACDSIARATIPPRGDATRRRDAPRASKIRATKNLKYISLARTHRVPRDVDGNPTARSNESQNVGLILEIERVRARGGRFRLFGGITHRDGARSRRRFSLDRSSALSRSLVDARREVTRRPTARAISIARIAMAFLSRCRRSMTPLSRVMTRRRFEHISHTHPSPHSIFFTFPFAPISFNFPAVCVIVPRQHASAHTHVARRPWEYLSTTTMDRRTHAHGVEDARRASRACGRRTDAPTRDAVGIERSARGVGVRVRSLESPVFHDRRRCDGWTV